jgi:dTDP-4-dehydrorhamnose reductase
MDKIKLWIVGSQGLLGSTLSTIAQDAVLSTKKDADIGNLSSLERFVDQNRGITHIINCSAYSQVDLAEKERDEAHRVNAIGPENLGKIGAKISAHVIHISTDYVFPGNEMRPLTEEDLVKPLNFYGKTKLEGEERLLNFLPSACVIRTSALFGKGGKNFVAKMVQMFKEKEEVLLTEDQWNSPTLAEDLSRAILEMLDQSGIYHFSNGGKASKFTFGSFMFAKILEKKETLRLVSVPSRFFPSLCPRPIYSVFDTTKISKKLSFSIRSWEEALTTFLEG